jgi:hypothetical protein
MLKILRPRIIENWSLYYSAGCFKASKESSDLIEIPKQSDVILVHYYDDCPYQSSVDLRMVRFIEYTEDVNTSERFTADYSSIMANNRHMWRIR